MSAQFESVAKRMQHGFAGRNGLFGTFMARGGDKGIERVLEREYGGFLGCFAHGSGHDPEFRAEEVTRGLGEVWQTERATLKTYASMGATHASVDCVAKLQGEHREKMGELGNIKKVKFEMGSASFGHGGWKGERPLTVMGAQMNIGLVAASQIRDRQVLLRQFSDSSLNDDSIWELVSKVECTLNESFDQMPGFGMAQRCTIDFIDGSPSISAEVAGT